MTGTRWMIATVLASCIAIALMVLFVAMRSSRGKVSEASFGRIENGMTMAQVESILGGPAEASISPQCAWTGDEGEETLIVIVDFDQDEKVASKKMHKITLPLTIKLLRVFGFSIL